MNVTEIGIAEMAVASNPAVLVTRYLGSCVGIALYDPISKIGGLAHVMQPDSTLTKKADKPAKFADLAVKAMLKKMINKGAKKYSIVAKIVGGANMFSSVSDDSVMNIGSSIVNASKTALEKEGIKIVAQDVGKDYSRTVEFDTKDGSVRIKSVGRRMKII